MLKKKKRNSKKIFTITSIIVVVILLIYSINIIRNTNIIEYSFKYISDMILTSTSAIVNKESNLVITTDKELKSEIEELKKQLDLKNTYTNYELENATVIVRNKSYWLDNLIIDKGKKDGIKKDMAVITKDGLIGIISKVYRNSSEVRLITTNNNKKKKLTIYIETDNGDFIGYIDKYDKNKKLLVIKDIDKNSDIKVGDRVMTSGMNNVFPKGIYIGEVKNIKEDENNLSKIIYAEVKHNLNKIHYVAVVKKSK